MTYKSLKTISLGVALLASLSAIAQDFDSELQLSNDETTYWYRICNAATGMDGYAMTDLGPETEDINLSYIYLLPTETEDIHSQWKLTAGEDGKIIITNRSTGNQISNISANMGEFNATKLADGSVPGFTVTSLGDDAFQLESVEDDGVNRCLASAYIESEPLSYPESDASSSIVGWKFFPVEIETGIATTQAVRPVISVKNKRISVKGCPEWQLFNSQGEEMPRTTRLATGVYLVKLPQKAFKVAIP
ncbi:MAG: hypothetical protein IKU02_06595 [Bacteroidaceae bacterium]|nr:hypothetical protein [Bacteroidaceae bacterium]